MGLILLDRDGVLNSLVVDEEHGTVDSPLNPDQVVVYPWVPESLVALQRAGYGLAIVTNQPAVAKKKTTLRNLERVHDRVLEICQSGGATILSSHICFHRREDACTCRKPEPGLLNDALKKNREFSHQNSWMVGDGITDIKAGVALGLKTAFLGPKKCDHCKVFEKQALRPSFWCDNLKEFTDWILKERG